MTREDPDSGEIFQYDRQGQPKIKFVREYEDVERGNKSYRQSVSVRHSNRRGGMYFKTDLISKFRRFSYL